VVGLVPAGVWVARTIPTHRACSFRRRARTRSRRSIASRSPRRPQPRLCPGGRRHAVGGTLASRPRVEAWRFAVARPAQPPGLSDEVACPAGRGESALADRDRTQLSRALDRTRVAFLPADWDPKRRFFGSKRWCSAEIGPKRPRSPPASSRPIKEPVRRAHPVDLAASKWSGEEPAHR